MTIHNFNHKLFDLVSVITVTCDGKTIYVPGQIVMCPKEIPHIWDFATYTLNDYYSVQVLFRNWVEFFSDEKWFTSQDKKMIGLFHADELEPANKERKNEISKTYW